MTLEDTMARASKHLSDYYNELVNRDELITSIGVEDTARDLSAGVGQLQRRLAVLSEPLIELVNIAMELTIPAGCEVKISAVPDIYVERPDGHWFGFRTAQGFGADGSTTTMWIPWRCSMGLAAAPRFRALQELVDHYGTLAL